MSFTKDERVKIWGDIKSLCSDDMQNECEDKLQKLFAYKNYDVYFERLKDLHYAFNPLTNNTNDDYIENIETEKALFAMLDAYEEYEYFYKHVKINKKDYDYNKIREKFEYIEPLLISESKITLRVPLHPNPIYIDTLYTLIEDCHIKRETAIMLLNILYDVGEKLKLTKQAKREDKKIFDVLNAMLIDAEQKGHDKDDIERERTELKKLFKHR